MKIAYVVSDLTYPPREGLHQQTILLIDALQRRGHEVHLFGFIKDLEKLDEVALRSEKNIYFRARPVASSSTMLRQALSEVQRKMFRLSSPSADFLQQLHNGDYDAVHLEGITACVAADKMLSAKAVHSFVDPGSRRNVRLAYNTQSIAAKLRLWAAAAAHFAIESSLRANGRMWHVVSASDRRYLRQVHRHSNVYSIPVMLPRDFDEVPINNSVMTDVAQNAPRRLQVLFFCDLRQEYMRLALSSFLGSVAQVSTFEPKPTYRVLGRVAKDPLIESAFQGLEYELVPWVEDYRVTLTECDLLVLPDSVGTGLKNRAIQGLWAGVAVLGSPVAFEGIPVVPEVHASVASTVEEFRERYSRLLEDASLRRRLGANGHQFAVANFSESSVVDAWLTLYEKVGDRDELSNNT